MTIKPSNAINSANLTEHEIYLAEAYAESASQDKLIAMDFEFALNDGLVDEHMIGKPSDASARN